MKVAVLIEPSGPGLATRTALALAARLGAETVAVTAGPPSASSTPLPVGRAFCIADPSLAEAPVEVIGPLLAAALRQVQADLVLAGMASDGEGRGIVPAAVANALNTLYLARVEDLEAAGDKVIASVRAGGQRRRVEVGPPAVLTVLPAALELPAGAAEIEPLYMADLTVTPAVLGNASDALGTLERARHRTATVKSAAELLKRLR